MAGSAAGRPRLVATDLDGTLLRSDGSLSGRTREAIAAAEQAGIHTIFVTARPPRWMHDLADAVGGHGVAICGNGSFVFDAATREVTSSRGHGPEDLQRLIADLRQEFPDVALAVERADGYAREELFLDSFTDPYEVVGLDDLTTSPVGKLLARSAATDDDEFLRRVVELTAGRAEVGFSGAVGLAEMTAPGVTKASGLATWCGEQGVDAGDVWACGDMPNDLPMLAWAGRAFAVANAHADVLSAAHTVLASNDDDAVAGLLESLL